MEIDGREGQLLLAETIQSIASSNPARDITSVRSGAKLLPCGRAYADVSARYLAWGRCE